MMSGKESELNPQQFVIFEELTHKWIRVVESAKFEAKRYENMKGSAARNLFRIFTLASEAANSIYNSEIADAIRENYPDGKGMGDG